MRLSILRPYQKIKLHFSNMGEVIGFYVGEALFVTVGEVLFLTMGEVLSVRSARSVIEKRNP